MRLLHCADVHLDAAFAGLGPEAGRRRRQAIRESLTSIVELALEQKVDCLTIGGDLFEDTRVTRDTADFICRQLGRLSCPVLIAPGNHDYLHPGSAYATVSWPEQVHIFRSQQFAPVEVKGQQIFGAAHLQPKGTRNLLQGFRAPEGSLAIALFHGSERGQLPFQEEGKQDHAPFSENELEQAKLRFGLLGHFHTPRTTRLLVYPGNPEPLSFGEEGLRGAALVELGEGPVKVEIHRVSTFTMEERAVDVGPASNSEALVELLLSELPQEKTVGVRLRLTGELAPEVRVGPGELLKRLRSDPERSVELILGYRPRIDLMALSQSKDVRGQFVRSLMARDDFESALVQMALRCGLDALQGEAPAIL